MYNQLRNPQYIVAPMKIPVRVESEINSEEKMKKLIIVCVLVLGGCASDFGYGSPSLKHMDENLKLIKVKKSNMEQVKKIFGEPLRIRNHGSDQEWTYQYDTGKTGFFSGKLEGRKLLSLYFNKNGILKKVESENTDFTKYK